MYAVARTVKRGIIPPDPATVTISALAEERDESVIRKQIKTAVIFAGIRKFLAGCMG
jgi:hypothetical protein